MFLIRNFVFSVFLRASVLNRFFDWSIVAVSMTRRERMKLVKLANFKPAKKAYEIRNLANLANFFWMLWWPRSAQKPTLAASATASTEPYTCFGNSTWLHSCANASIVAQVFLSVNPKEFNRGLHRWARIGEETDCIDQCSSALSVVKKLVFSKL